MIIASGTEASADAVAPGAEGEPDNANAAEKAKKLLMYPSLKRELAGAFDGSAQVPAYLAKRPSGCRDNSKAI
jgi:hypothetical protein